MRTILSALLFSTLALSATARADEAKAAVVVAAPAPAAKPARHVKKSVAKTEVVKVDAKAEAAPVVSKTEVKATSKPAVKPVEAPKVQPRKVVRLRHVGQPHTKILSTK